MKEFIEKAFGIKDSKLVDWEYTIPEGFVASIENGKIIVKKEESEDDKIRKVVTLIIKGIRADVFEEKGISKEDAIAWLEKQGKDKEINNFDVLPGLYKCVHRMFDGTPDGKLLFEVGNIYKCLSKHDRAEFEVSYGHSIYLEDPVVCKHFIPFEKQGEQKQNPCSGTSFEYNGHTFGMCARDNGVEILMDGELKAFVSSEKSFVYPIHPQPDLASKNAMEAIKEEKVDNANKLEPKFKVGDWVVDSQGLTHQIERVVENVTTHTFGYDIVGGGYFNDDNEGVHLWTIKDAKDGDVLATSTGAFIYNGNNGGGSCPGSYCGIDTLGGFKTGVEHHWTGKPVFPSTKEQRDLLFQKMKESGYEWDAENKKLKKIYNALEECEIENIEHGKYYYCIKDYFAGGKKQASKGDVVQALRGLPIMGLGVKANEYFIPVNSIKVEKPVWSEDDEHKIKDIVYFLDTAKKHYASTVELDACIAWLKSLKDRVQPQSKYEWKQENTDALTDFENLMMHIGISFFGQHAGLDPNDTNAIKEQANILLGLVPKQKWSEEDGEEFKQLLDILHANGYESFDIWLKSLKDRVQTQWKPSEEQIQAIRLARSFVVDDFSENPALSEILMKLEEQLQKIREK